MMKPDRCATESPLVDEAGRVETATGGACVGEPLDRERERLVREGQALRNAQAKLEEALARMSGRYQWAPVPYIVLDPDGVIIDVNAASESVLALRRAELLGTSFEKLVLGEDGGVWLAQQRGLAAGRAESRFSLTLRRGDGVALAVDVAATRGVRAEGSGDIRMVLVEPAGRAAVHRDDALHAASALRESMAELRERRRLAEELHDDVGQTLSLASMRLAALQAEEGLEAGGPVSERMRELSAFIADARRKVSSLSFQLSPSVLYDVGLVAAAEWLGDDLRRSYGIEVSVEGADELADLDETARGVLFRALREFLINVARHAGTHIAQVRISRYAPAGQPAQAIVDVEDCGVGFDARRVEAGFGLLSVRERIGRLGGSVTIYTQLGDGTHVRIALPLALSAARCGSTA